MQTTVPFIDSQSVSPQPGTWISGAGLYHKGEIGYGGYVGLMLKTFDVSRHLVLKKDPSVAYRQARKNLWRKWSKLAANPECAFPLRKYFLVNQINLKLFATKISKLKQKMLCYFWNCFCIISLFIIFTAMSSKFNLFANLPFPDFWIF